MITEFKRISAEAKFRLKIKKEIKSLGFNLSNEMKKQPTEELLKIKDLLLNRKDTN